MRRKNDNEMRWFCSEFSNYDGSYFTLICGNKYHLDCFDILPYKGHEYLVGTLDEPEKWRTLKEGDLIVVFDDIKDVEQGYVSIRKFCGVNGDKVVCNNSKVTWNLCVPYSKFNADNIEETKKYILCGKDGKLVKFTKEL